MVDAVPVTDETEDAAAAIDGTEDPWVLHLVARVERPPVGPPPVADVLTAAGRAVVTLLHDVRAQPEGSWAEAMTAWEGLSIRKVARRARGAAWQRVVAGSDVVVVRCGGAEVAALPPTRRSETPAHIDPLQVGGLDLGPAPSVRDLELRRVATSRNGVATPDRLVAVLAPVAMSTGKAMAQVGHGAQLADRLLQLPDGVGAWAAAGWPMDVATATPAEWPALRRSALVEVHDAGHTEVDPGTVTVVMLDAAAIAAVLAHARASDARPFTAG